ncbi:MAG: 50S ribosomal protein L15 [Candidatus Yanofskybacteria bacterium GW2011_GWA1_48_10]|uniref:Large ribosomal subunit protein uL15 n=1 Tax=Candidatus Yanofskybacteria bacterium GW2011_GWA1_48_10 TaxID=1619022 RepID=A0A0G1U7A2_9BACT|nr:MAG: 50S ribosomal protein L15 [Candidatus Yanofskybacteria bacterium GW2011_GWA1_48_10]
MQLNNLQPKTRRKKRRYIGRGGKKGTTSGAGTKGQKSRAGASVKPGFRGGDSRIWQSFPKQRGSSHKSGGAGNNRPPKKHRFFQLHSNKAPVFNLEFLNKFSDGQEVTPQMLGDFKTAKILGAGELKKKLTLKGFTFSASAKREIEKIGGSIIS